jgi:hypothetical protein
LYYFGHDGHSSRFVVASEESKIYEVVYILAYLPRLYTAARKTVTLVLNPETVRNIYRWHVISAGIDANTVIELY